jgi:hypothetical protein
MGEGRVRSFGAVERSLGVSCIVLGVGVAVVGIGFGEGVVDIGLFVEGDVCSLGWGVQRGRSGVAGGLRRVACWLGGRRLVERPI